MRVVDNDDAVDFVELRRRRRNSAHVLEQLRLPGVEALSWYRCYHQVAYSELAGPQMLFYHWP